MTLLAFAKQSGLFIREYYEHRYSLAFESEQEAFNDFLRKIKFSNVIASPPSQNINRLNFGNLHGHDLPSNYIEYAYNNNIQISTEQYGAFVQWNSIDSKVLPITPNSLVESVAINIHLYYADMLDDFVNAISGFPVSVDIYIAVQNETIGKDAKEQFSKLEQVNIVHFYILQNRGRNFESFLLGFRESLKSYDLLIHVHSKKSLYSGSLKSGWFEYLIENLLRDKQLLVKHLSAFSNNPNLGILYPTSVGTSELPKWATHVLKNKSSLTELESILNNSTLNQNISLKKKSFLSYPVGGMFICRVRAIFPLLCHDWSYDDFPVEPIANDGTLLHAIERCFDSIVESQGYSSCYYHPSSGCHTYDTSHIFENYLDEKPLLNYVVDNSILEIISFDVFDTLVSRVSGYNDSAKVIASTKITSAVHPFEFLKIRNQAELECRKRSNFIGDVDIYQVYELLNEMIPLLLSPNEAAWCEFHADLDLLITRPDIESLYRKAFASSSKVIVISDIYYTKEMILEIFKKFKLPYSADDVHVSSFLGLRKDNGSIWDFITEKYSKECSNFMGKFSHIGDNVVSDAQIPMEHGFSTFHILSPEDKCYFNELKGNRGAKIANLLHQQDPILNGHFATIAGLTAFITEPNK
tara:strand:- start:1133 stop:3049 length:1917 start_codon:yes stop_codon:yes gene_type:complete